MLLYFRQEQFRLTKSGLFELFNHIAINGDLTQALWEELDELLKQVVVIWKSQQAAVERERIEKESLYKNRAQLKGDVPTEEEELAEEIRNLFPTSRGRDFADIDEGANPSLEQNRMEIDQENETDIIPMISDSDVVEIADIHSMIVKSFVASEWLTKKQVDSKQDFIKPLLLRYKTFGTLIDHVTPGLGNDITKKLHTSLNVLTNIASDINQGLETKEHKKSYDYYKDSNVEEVKRCVPLLDAILKKVSELMEEWPDHPTLISIKIIIQRIFSFPIISPLSRFLAGAELLLVKMHEWEQTSHSGVSLCDYTLNLTHQIISWRKLELACWKDCLNNGYLKSSNRASKWWFFLYALFQSYVEEDEGKKK